MEHLDQLENESIFIIREAFKRTRNLALLWSMGKDSTVLMHLVRKAFVGNFPIPLIHIDTSYKIPQMIEWRDETARKYGFKLIVGQNKEALANGMNHTLGRITCCTALKTEALLQIVKEHDIHGLMLGIRRDEEGSRSKERIVSPRSDLGSWAYTEQPAEVWQYYNLHLPPQVHLRIHPILHWTELDVWRYIERENLDVMPLYFATEEGKRYRSLGCAPCTSTVESGAKNIREIIEELEAIKTTERSGRAQDKEISYAMQELRKQGYM